MHWEARINSTLFALHSSHFNLRSWYWVHHILPCCNVPQFETSYTVFRQSTSNEICVLYVRFLPYIFFSSYKKESNNFSPVCDNWAGSSLLISRSCSMSWQYSYNFCFVIFEFYLWLLKFFFLQRDFNEMLQYFNTAIGLIALRSQNQ